MSPPLSLSDSQMDSVMHAALPLAPDDPSLFLRDVAAALAGLPELGDGAVARVARELQARYLKPPRLHHENGAQSKYR
jgi:hypothetical protein